MFKGTPEKLSFCCNLTRPCSKCIHISSTVYSSSPRNNEAHQRTFSKWNKTLEELINFRRTYPTTNLTNIHDFFFGQSFTVQILLGLLLANRAKSSRSGWIGLRRLTNRMSRRVSRELRLGSIDVRERKPGFREDGPKEELLKSISSPLG